MQHPILAALPGGGDGVGVARARALRPVCESLDRAITQLDPHDPCAASLREVSRMLRLLSRQPDERPLRLAGLRR